MQAESTKDTAGLQMRQCAAHLVGTALHIISKRNKLPLLALLLSAFCFIFGQLNLLFITAYCFHSTSSLMSFLGSPQIFCPVSLSLSLLG